MDNKLQYINGLRIVGMLMVILGHSLGVFSQGWVYTSLVKAPKLHWIDVYVSSFHVPLFVFVSGFLYSYGKFHKGRYSNFFSFIQNKSKRLLIPYLCIGILYMIPIQKIIHYGPYNGRSLINLVFNGIILGRVVDHLWFVFMLFNVFWIFKLLEKLIMKCNFALVLSVLLILNYFSWQTPNYFQLHTALRFLVFFYVGFKAFQYQNKLNWLLSAKYAVAFFVMHLLACGLCYHYRMANKYGEILYGYGSTVDFVIAMLGITFIYIFMNLFFRQHDLSNNIAYKYLNRYNFSIYLLHEPILFIFLSKFAQTTINPVLLASMCFFGSISISIILSAIFEKNKFTKAAIGL